MPGKAISKNAIASVLRHRLRTFRLDRRISGAPIKTPVTPARGLGRGGPIGIDDHEQQLDGHHIDPRAQHV